MRKNGSVLMISLWILAILVIFALGLGRRAAITLKLARFQRDRLKAELLAKAAINRAILELKNDADTNYDAPDESWADNQKAFEKIVLDENQNEFAAVSYSVNKDGKEETKFGLTDEESKININRIDGPGQKQLSELFIFSGLAIDEAKELTNIIVNWIDEDKNPMEGLAEDEKIFKNAPLKTPEEILLILEYFFQQKGGGQEFNKGNTRNTFDNIKSLITIYGNGKINANTASEQIFTIVANSVAKSDEEKNCVAAVVEEIIRQREEKEYFKRIEDIVTNDNLITGTTADINLFDNLKKELSAQSNNFRINAIGNVNNTVKNITVVYDRANNLVAYWHQN